MDLEDRGPLRNGNFPKSQQIRHNPGIPILEIPRPFFHCGSGPDISLNAITRLRRIMVEEFDKVVFSAEVGKVVGPVQTQFGYHLIEVTSRTD